MVVRRAFAALVLASWATAAVANAARDHEAEREIFPKTQESIPNASPRLSTTYWKITLEVRLARQSDGESWVRVTLPLSDERQTILSRQTVSQGFDVSEEPAQANLLGKWSWRSPDEPGVVRLDWTAQVSDARVEPPRGAYPTPEPPGGLAADLAPSAYIQSKDPEIAERARELVRSAKRLDEAVWALFQFTGAFLETDPATPKLDARSVLRDGKGSAAGKARLLTAFLRAVGIPARFVGGLRLKDASKTRGTISWVEAHLDGRWFPMDPTNGNFGFVPNDVFALYRGDLPLIVHPSRIDVEYDFLVRQVTRKAIFEEDGEVRPAAVVKSLDPPEVVSEKERVQTVATYVHKPVATVVVVTDADVPQAVVDRMRTEAIANDLNLVLLMARFQSRYFRGNYLQRLVATNLAAIREAHVLLVSTRDEAGLFSLLELGEHRLELSDARIVIAGSFQKSVGRVLGAVLYDLLQPGELALFHDAAELASLWEVARSNLIQGTPIVEASRNWGLSATVIDEAAFRSLSGYRRRIVEGWASAVRARIPLQALTLILVLPVIAFVVVILRNFVGLDSFGLFSPVIVSLAFLATGIAWGSLIFVVIVGLGVLLRHAIQHLRLHLVARLGILIALVSVVMTGLTVFGAVLGVGALLQVSLFPMVIMSNLIENFTASQLELGTWGAIRLTLNTMLVCVLCYLAVEGTGIATLLLAFPEILIGIIAAEVAAGKWRGLRLLEYKRFYDLLRRARPETRSSAERAA